METSQIKIKEKFKGSRPKVIGFRVYFRIAYNLGGHHAFIPKEKTITDITLNDGKNALTPP